MQNDNKLDLLTNKSSKYLFYWYSNFVEWKELPVQKIRHLKISEDFVGLVKIQESNWQYPIENFITRTKNFDLKGKITEKEPKSLKEIKKCCKICKCVYNTVCGTIAENFHEYLHTLEFDEIEEINNDIKLKSNGWGLNPNLGGGG